LKFPVIAYTATSALGRGLDRHAAAISNSHSGLRPNDFPGCDLATWIGRVDGLEQAELPRPLAHLDSRNNRLAWLGVQQDGFVDSVRSQVKLHGAERVGMVLGTSTSSMGQTEQAYRALDAQGRFAAGQRQPLVHNPHSAACLLAEVTGSRGPAITVSTACSSSARVFARAAEWLQLGLVDACLVAGIDSLCLSVLYGFNSLELLSPDPCRPFDLQRKGINIGEAAGFALLARPGSDDPQGPRLVGWGESSDAHHMSHPHPEGLGALLAMDQALERAGLGPADIDYVNCHGTASQANDQVEAAALAARFGERTLASATKGWTGHCLGAAGIIEAVITWQAMAGAFCPGTLTCEQVDPACAFPILRENRQTPLRRALSNSFGFGGSNASLVFETSSC
jgi:3-oxoacyl-[acyl-carrier-protein] synthase-1